MSGGGNQTESQSEKENTAEKQRNPSVSNLHWENTNNQTITKALVGDEVYLCADVTDIADGASAKIKIVEKDDDGNDDFVAELSASVQDGKIRRKWKVVYTEDNDDTDSRQELEEKGYTLPEYAFTVECDGIESKESEQLDVMGWIKINLAENLNLPLDCHIVYPSGTVKKICLNKKNNQFFVKEHGKFYVFFED